MSGSAVEPLAPRERPTEPGWYVVERGQAREVMYALPPKGEMMADCYGEFHMPDFITFIARIYPDRIEGREG